MRVLRSPAALFAVVTGVLLLVLIGGTARGYAGAGAGLLVGMLAGVLPSAEATRVLDGLAGRAMGISTTGSWIGTPPALRMSILRGSTSRQRTSLPTSARQVPETRPT